MEDSLLNQMKNALSELLASDAVWTNAGPEERDGSRVRARDVVATVRHARRHAAREHAQVARGDTALEQGQEPHLEVAFLQVRGTIQGD